MRILLLGGYGFLGANILKYIDENYFNKLSVIVFDRVALHPHGLQFRCVEKAYAGDFADILSINDIFQHNKIDYVIHAISTTIPNSAQNAIYDIESNLISTIRLLDSMNQHGVKDIAFISSGGAIYGDCINNQPHKESDAVFPKSSYGVTKLAIEKYMLQYANLYNMRPLVLRLSNPYGKYHYSMKQGVCNVALRSAIELIPFNVWGDGSSQKDYVYVEDFCDILFKLMDKKIHTTVINIASGQIVSLSTILSIVKKYSPDFSWNFVEQSKFDVVNVKLDNSKLIDLLGEYSFTPLEDGIKRVLNWLLEGIDSK